MMMKDLKRISNAEVSGLRRVGDLQYYGMPMLSLYYDIRKKLLYLSLSAYQKKEYSSCIFFSVNKDEVLLYMDNDINLHEWMMKYESYGCYLKKNYREDNLIEWYMMDVIPENLIPEDDSFDEDFCKDKYRIKNFLHGDKYEIKNNEMSKDLIYGIL